MKKQLAKELYDLYKEQNIIFTEYKKGSNVFKIKKWKQKTQQPFENKKKLDKSLIEAKFADQNQIRSETKPNNQFYEDDMCVALWADEPVAKIHFLV